MKENIIQSPALIPVNKLDDTKRRLLPGLYEKAWAKNGLPHEEISGERVLQFHPEFSFVLIDETNAKEVFGLLNVIPAVETDSTSLANRFPTYASVEEEAKNPSDSENFNTLVMFSIVGKGGFRVFDKSKSVSISKFITDSVKTIFPNKRIAAYTRMHTIEEGVTPEEHYETYKNDTRKLGALGMHIYLGADPETMVILHNSRPLDLKAAGCNEIVFYA